jgi:hypothetical protein
MMKVLADWIRRDPERPLRVLFASDFGDLAGMFCFLIEQIIKLRPVTPVEHLDLCDLTLDARESGCDMIFIWNNGHVRDRESIGRNWRDYVPRAAKLRREFPAVPVIFVTSNHESGFPERVREAGAHMFYTPTSFEDFEKGFETWRSVGGGL